MLFKFQISRLHSEKVLEDPAWAAPKSLGIFSAAHSWGTPVPVPFIAVRSELEQLLGAVDLGSLGGGDSL